MASDGESESNDSESVPSEQSSAADDRSDGTFYFRSIRWIFLVGLVLMAIMSLSIFTDDSLVKLQRLDALYVSMGSLALVGLGIYGAYHVRIYYVIFFTFLLLCLIVFKLTTPSFQRNMLSSMALHLPHFISLFCGIALICIALCNC